jgi:hypothetical protein
MSHLGRRGLIIINLSFSQHTDSVYKKAQQRLFLLRKLRSSDVRQDILTAVYKSLIDSVLTFNITSMV